MCQRYKACPILYELLLSSFLEDSGTYLSIVIKYFTGENRAGLGIWSLLDHIKREINVYLVYLP